jgi:MerR family mercuric resistance operon transcriptional regulator
MPEMTIGKLAQSAGVNVETIRYYQRLKLLEQPARPPGGVRRYAEAAVARVRFIKRAQELGFSLAEIHRLLRLGDPQSCGEARALAAEKRALVESRVAPARSAEGPDRALRPAPRQGRLPDHREPGPAELKQSAHRPQKSVRSRRFAQPRALRLSKVRVLRRGVLAHQIV